MRRIRLPAGDCRNRSVPNVGRETERFIPTDARAMNKPLTSPRPPASPLAAGATVPLSFIAAGLLAGASATVWLFCSPGLLALPHVHPHVVAFAHLWLLGSLLTICSGAIYQLLPVLANTAFTGNRLAWTHLALHVSGVAVMVSAFAHAAMGTVAIGGSLVTLGVGCLALNIGRTLRAASRFDAVLAAFACAAGWLLLTVLVGVAFAANLRFGWFGVDVLAVLRAHAHLGVVGFFVTLLQGAMFRLVPMFTLAAACDLRRVRTALVLSQTGLVVLVPALAFGNTIVEAIATGLFVGSFVITAVELRRLWGTRKKRALEPGLRGFFLGLGALGVSTLLGGTLVAGVADLRGALAYGVIAIVGGVLATVQGMLCKVVPFLVWMRVYGPRVGRQPTPQAAALGRPALERAWITLHFTGVVLLAGGAAMANLFVLAVGAGAFAAGQIALLGSLGAVARHLRSPVVSTASTASGRSLPPAVISKTV
jgi:hypothetical protein